MTGQGDGGGRGGGGGGGGGEETDIKSNNPHLTGGEKEKQEAKARRGLSMVTLSSLTCFDTCCLNEARLRCTIWVYDNDVCTFLHVDAKSQQNELPKQFN